MECLFRLLEVPKSKKFKYHPRCSKNKITYLTVANDLLQFCYGDLQSIHATLECFNKFSKCSGLEAILAKYKYS